MTPTDAALGPIVLIGLFVTISYIATCAVWPFKACRRCHGSGKLRSPLVKAIRLCPRCEATGLRIRIGRHVWNRLRRVRRANNRNRTAHRNR